MIPHGSMLFLKSLYAGLSVVGAIAISSKDRDGDDSEQ